MSRNAVKINCSGHDTCVIIGTFTLRCQEKVYFSSENIVRWARSKYWSRSGRKIINLVASVYF